jgi:hypothetical protein
MAQVIGLLKILLVLLDGWYVPYILLHWLSYFRDILVSVRGLIIVYNSVQIYWYIPYIIILYRVAVTHDQGNGRS